MPMEAASCTITAAGIVASAANVRGGGKESLFSRRRPVPAGCRWEGEIHAHHRLAETLSKRHTMTGGHRSLDVLHVATALHLGAREFLTFDANQRKLATAEKLKVKP
jgi:predicted nucleic acid-binding protein